MKGRNLMKIFTILMLQTRQLSVDMLHKQ